MTSHSMPAASITSIHFKHCRPTRAYTSISSIVRGGFFFLISLARRLECLVLPISSHFMPKGAVFFFFYRMMLEFIQVAKQFRWYVQKPTALDESLYLFMYHILLDKFKPFLKAIYWA